MASKVRSGVKSILVSALFGLLIASFAIWGVGGGMFVASGRVVATVGETNIETEDLKRNVDNQAREYQLQYGGAVSAQDIILGLQLHQRTLQQMITSAALTDSAATLGLRGSDIQLSKEMLKIDAFQPIKKGVIDRETMMQTLQTAGLTYKKYITDTKNLIAQEQLINAVTAATPVPRILAEKLYSFRNEIRSATLLSLPGSIIKNVASPAEGELEDYYNIRKDAYMAPEYRTYNYVLLTPESFEDKVVVSEDALREEFEYKQSEYSTPASRTMQQVSLETEDAAKLFIERVNSGEDFTKVAVAMSDFTEEEITLPTSDYEQVEADFSKETADVVFALGIGEVSNALEGPAGWSFFKIVDLTEGSSTSYEDVRNELKDAYVKDQAINLLYDFTEKVEEVLSEGGDLTEVSNQLNIPMATLTEVDVQGRDKNGKNNILTEVGSTILRAAYQSEIGDFLELKDINANADDRRMYMLELTDVVDPAQKPLESVQSELLASWESEKRQKLIGEIAETALERIRNGESSEALALELDGTSYSAKNIRRSDNTNSNISTNLRRLIFSMKINDTDMEVAADGNGYIIAKLDKVKSGDIEANQGQIDVILAELETSMGNELMAQYQIDLGKSLEIVVNQPVFERTFNIPQR